MLLPLLCLSLLASPPLSAVPASTFAARGAGGDTSLVLSLRERARVRDAWLARRLERVVPELMRREGIDLWLVVSREYNEDPVFWSMAPSTWLAARRRTILLFHDTGTEVERLAVSRYGVGDLFASAWDPEQEPDQWAALAQLVRARDPERIAIDVSPTFALADGLSSSEHEALMQSLPAELAGRIVSAERLAVGWLETRIEEELAVYPSLARLAHEIIAEGLSEAAITPGVTSTDDVRWFYRERIRELRLTTWFHPSVSVQRWQTPADPEIPETALSFASEDGPALILPGDLIHVDFGITYLGLNTDTQQHAYVLRPGETAAPPGLVRGLAAGNRAQELLIDQFRTGRTGNDVLARALEACRAEGLEATIYSHPLGFHGHGAGPTLGLWDQQGGVPGRGDYPLFPSTVFSIELSVRVTVPEWRGQEVDIMLEEDAHFDGESVRWLDGRQTELLLVPRPLAHQDEASRAARRAAGSRARRGDG